MPRRKIKFVQGEIYHLYNRGAGKANIFFSADNYYFFINKCWTYSKSLSIPIIAFCLMPNHYHLLVLQAGDISAGNLAQRVCNSYSKALNNMLERTGTVFEGRYQAKVVASQDYLECLCAYVHLNPVVAGIVSKPEDWPYSDFHRWINWHQEQSSMNLHRKLGLTHGEEYREILYAILAGKRDWPQEVIC
jgi:REP element-mobilizing transposase RayT